MPESRDDLRPLLHDGEYVFATVEGLEAAAGLGAVAAVCEDGAMSVVIPVRAAEEAGVEAAFACEWITLQAETELDMVGLTAEFASRLADAGIPCNVVAGTRHDHLFVPAGRGAEAVALLT